MKVYFLLVIQICLIHSLDGQIFQDVTSQMNINHSFDLELNGAGCSFYDFNRDGLDDISLPIANEASLFYLNNGDDSFSLTNLGSLPGQQRSLIWVDYDNDGDSDLSYAAFGGIIRLFKNTGDLQFEEVSLDFPTNTVTSNYGISWGDYDNDGFLDMYVCRYPDNDYPYSGNNHNVLYKNNGDDTFTDVTFTSMTDDGYKASFMATWIDINHDGFQDIHVINDRTSFKNSFYLNNGDGTFDEIATELGIDISILSMSNTIGDFDNDGDYDIYVSDGPLGNKFLKQLDTGAFENLFPNSGTETFRGCWGGNFVDYDNNGWKDLFVCVENDVNFLYENNVGINFITTPDILPQEEYKSFSCAKGDYNNDGLYDLLILNETPGTSRLLENNHDSAGYWVKVTLEGSVSNRDAIGTRLTYYTENLVQREYTYCGSDFMSQDSQHKILSIGDNAKIDSLEIVWPMGLTEWYYGIVSYSDLNLIEGATLSADISNSGEISLCAEDQIELSVDADYDTILWSDLSDSPSLTVTEPGEYYATVTFAGNFSIQTESLTVLEEPAPQIQSISITEPNCFGFDDGIAQITYSDQENELTTTYENLTADMYSYIISSDDHCDLSVEFTVDQPSELVSIATPNNAECFGENGSVTFSSFGGISDYEYFIEPEGDLGVLTDGEYSFSTEDAQGCIYEGEFTITVPEELIITVDAIENATDDTLGSITTSVSGGTGDLTIEWEGLTDTSLSIENLVAGEYCMTVTDINGCSAESCVTVDFTSEISEITNGLNALILYPNPANDFISISNLSNNKKTIEIFNHLGQSIVNLESEEEIVTISTESLSNGVYKVLLTSGKQRQTLEFIKTN